MAKQGLVTEILPSASDDSKQPDFPSKKEGPSIPVVEEKAVVSTELVDVSKVRLSKTVEEVMESVDVTTSEEEVVVQRIPKNQIVDKAPDGVRYEGDTMIIPVLKEVAVVEKKIMLVEEIHVSRKKHQSTKTIDVPVRKEKVNVERKPVNRTKSSR